MRSTIMERSTADALNRRFQTQGSGQPDEVAPNGIYQAGSGNSSGNSSRCTPEIGTRWRRSPTLCCYRCRDQVLWFRKRQHRFRSSGGGARGAARREVIHQRPATSVNLIAGTRNHHWSVLTRSAILSLDATGIARSQGQRTVRYRHRVRARRGPPPGPHAINHDHLLSSIEMSLQGGLVAHGTSQRLHLQGLLACEPFGLAPHPSIAQVTEATPAPVPEETPATTR